MCGVVWCACSWPCVCMHRHTVHRWSRGVLLLHEVYEALKIASAHNFMLTAVVATITLQCQTAVASPAMIATEID